MSAFLIKLSDGDIFELTTTQQVSMAATSDVTQYPVEDGGVASDHVVNKNITYTLNGLISDIRRVTRGTDYSFSSSNISDSALLPFKSKGSLDTQKQVEDYIAGVLTQIRDKKDFFDFIFDERLATVRNCLLQDFTVERDVTTGLGYNVSMNIVQTRKVKSVTSTVSRSNPDLNGPITSAGESTTIGTPIKDAEGSLIVSFLGG